MATEDSWTLDELVQLVADALAGDAYPGAPNGRVRDVPDRRAVRWYATIGLVDRPIATRGRTARYGVRHLLQLVAIKRRQAQGRTLAEIQAELTGASDATLRRIAALPDELPSPRTGEDPHIDEEPHTDEEPARARFWAAPPPLETPPKPAAPAPPTLTGVPLPGGVLLLVPAQPGPDDLSAIHAAARPLLDLLADRGLLAIRPDPAADRSA
jgi:DNA-binding transcriptional MerR regulator